MSIKEPIVDTQNAFQQHPTFRKSTEDPRTTNSHYHRKKYFHKNTLLFVLRKQTKKSAGSVFDCTNKLTPYGCHKCRHYTTLFFEHLRHHLRTNCKPPTTRPKSKTKTFKCDHCSYKSREKRDVANHTLRRHTNKSEIVWIQCDQCTSKFKLKSDLQKHRVKHDEERHWWKCELCPYETPYISNLHAHVKRKHVTENKWIQCEQCPYKSVSIHIMRRHKLTLHESLDNIEWFHCTQCPYKGKTRDYLRKHHQRYHLKIYKYYECDKCTYRGFSNATLRDHVIRMHVEAAKIQWLQCDHCPAKFKVKDTLRRHMIKCERLALEISTKRSSSFDFQYQVEKV
ncbi:zinc finger Y-chromosomal protein-like [Zophobas morio]|uniref:zinc finger Y-chromosomal protein-like n=1 Tax=Zophobas morio TaxID=2755281 RepID=UPI003083BCDA